MKKYLMFTFILSLLFISGCQRAKTGEAYYSPSEEPAGTPEEPEASITPKCDLNKCKAKSGWYDTGDPWEWVTVNDCEKKEQRRMVYKDHYCDKNEECVYKVTGTPQWRDTGRTYKEPDGTSCNLSPPPPLGPIEGFCKDGKCVPKPTTCTKDKDCAKCVQKCEITRYRPIRAGGNIGRCVPSGKKLCPNSACINTADSCPCKYSTECPGYGERCKQVSCNKLPAATTGSCVTDTRSFDGAKCSSLEETRRECCGGICCPEDQVCVDGECMGCDSEPRILCIPPGDMIIYINKQLSVCCSLRVYKIRECTIGPDTVTLKTSVGWEVGITPVWFCK